MKTQRIAIFGAGGKVGREIMEEALKRGHSVTAIVNSTNDIDHKDENLTIIEGKIIDKDDIRKHVRDHDVVICAYEPTATQAQNHVLITKAVIEGTKDSGVERLVAVGNAFMQPTDDSNEVYDGWRSIAEAQHQVLEIFKDAKGLDWSYSHNIDFEPITNSYNQGNKVFITNANGETKRPIKKLISSILDEIEIIEYLGEENMLSI